MSRINRVIFDDTSGVCHIVGDGSPAAGSGIAAPIGSTYARRDGSSLSTFYVKVGSANTAWEAAGSGGGGSSTPVASTGTSGTVKTDTTTADPIVYLKSSVDTLLATKANSATTLAGYGITNAYTKTEIDNGFLPLTGGTVTNGIAVSNGGVTLKGNLHVGLNATTSTGIEIGNDLAASTTPFIDFHYGVGGSVTRDYSARFLANADNRLAVLFNNGNGTMAVDGRVEGDSVSIVGGGVFSAAGTWGSLTLSGVNSTYAGINFSSVGRYLMIEGNRQGIWTGSAWQWSFNAGVLENGSVPASLVTAGTMGGARYRFIAANAAGSEWSNASILVDAGSRTKASVAFLKSGSFGGQFYMDATGKFHLKNDADTSYCQLQVSTLTAGGVTCTGTITASGTVNGAMINATGSMFVNSRPVGGVIISSSTPSGTASEGTFWAQV